MLEQGEDELPGYLGYLLGFEVVALQVFGDLGTADVQVRTQQLNIHQRTNPILKTILRQYINNRIHKLLPILFLHITRNTLLNKDLHDGIFYRAHSIRKNERTYARLYKVHTRTWQLETYCHVY